MDSDSIGLEKVVAALRVLREYPGSNRNFVFGHMKGDSDYVSKTLDETVDMGLVSVKRVPDRRIKCVYSITSEGIEFVNKLDGLLPSEFDKLNSYLERYGFSKTSNQKYVRKGSKEVAGLP